MTSEQQPQQQDVQGPPEDILGWSAEDICAAQRKDVEINFVIQLMESSKEIPDEGQSDNVKVKQKPDWSQVEGQSANVKSLWNEWERLVLKEEILFRRWTSVDGSPNRLQVVLLTEHRRQFIYLAHTGMTGGHLGRAKTEEQVRLRAYWPNWRT